jgi:hypothetical protein
MDRTESILNLLRENTTTYPEVQLPQSVADRILYLKNFCSYDTELAIEIVNLATMHPMSDTILVEMIGRYKALHYYIQRLDSLSMESIISIRSEIQKRKDVYKNLNEILNPDRQICWSDLKTLMSGLTRVIIEMEKLPETSTSLMEVSQIVFGSVGKKLSDLDCNLLRFLFLGGLSHG